MGRAGVAHKLQDRCAARQLACRRGYRSPWPLMKEGELPQRTDAPGAVPRGVGVTPVRACVSGDREPPQKPLTLSRPLERVFPFSDDVGTVLFMMALLIAAAEEPGLFARYSAAAPLTCGVAIDVPL